MNGIESLSPRKTIRIAVVGDHKSGKTTMLNTLTERSNSDINITTSVELFYKRIYINNEVFLLQIWDTMGHDVLKHLNKNYLINIDMLIIVFQYGNKKSLNNALLWKELYLSTIKDDSKKINIVILGNIKNKNYTDITDTEIEAFCKFHNMMYYELYPFDKITVDNIFLKLVHKLQINTEDINSNVENENCCYTPRKNMKDKCNDKLQIMKYIKLCLW